MMQHFSRIKFLGCVVEIGIFYHQVIVFIRTMFDSLQHTSLNRAYTHYKLSLFKSETMELTIARWDFVNLHLIYVFKLVLFLIHTYNIFINFTKLHTFFISTTSHVSLWTFSRTTFHINTIEGQKRIMKNLF